jgi:hypothetical protein
MRPSANILIASGVLALALSFVELSTRKSQLYFSALISVVSLLIIWQSLKQVALASRVLNVIIGSLALIVCLFEILSCLRL